MKIRELLSYFRDESKILEKTLKEDSSYEEIYSYYLNFHEITLKQERNILDLEVPSDLCLKVLALSTKRYIIKKGNLYKIPPYKKNFLLKLRKIYTAEEIYKLYGGECLEEVEEYGSCKV